MVRAEDDLWSQSFEAGKNSLMADDLADAENNFKTALGVAERSGELDERVIQSLNCLALTYFRRDDHQFAEVTYSRALACADEMYGPENPKVLISLNGLAFFLLHTKRFAKAEPLYLRVLTITEKLRGANHLEVATATKNLAFLYEKLNQHSKAKSFYQRAIDIFDQVAPTHPDRDSSRAALKKLFALSAQQSTAETTMQMKKPSTAPAQSGAISSVNKRPNADNYVIRKDTLDIDDSLESPGLQEFENAPASGTAPDHETKVMSYKQLQNFTKPVEPKTGAAGGPPGKKSLWDNLKDLVSPGKKVSVDTARPVQAKTAGPSITAPSTQKKPPATAPAKVANAPLPDPIAAHETGEPAMAASAEQKRPPEQQRGAPESAPAPTKGVPSSQSVSGSQKKTDEIPQSKATSANSSASQSVSQSTSQQGKASPPAKTADQSTSGVNAKATGNAADPLAQSWQKINLGNLFGGGKKSGANEPDSKVSAAKPAEDLESTGPRGVHKDSREKLIGTKIDNRYLVESFIDAGGMSVVYKATHVMMGRTVAIKMMHSELAQKETFLKRFQQEARTASVLAHPNIVSLHDFGITSDGLLYIVMDFVEGTTLDEVIHAGQVQPARAINILMQACDGLAHAHEKDILHRDLKPSNLMLIKGDREEVKVVDFGLAKSMSEMEPANMKLTRTGEFVGSPLYMSPEQFRVKQLDARSDIYSLGCVGYEVLTGKTAFNGETFGEILAKHMAEDPLPFDQACPERNLPKPLEAVIFKALEKAPNDRYATMTEFKDKLQEALSH